MNKSQLTSEEIYKATTRAQGDAAHPENSIFVSANAGTGKTHILVGRVLRLLLAGSEPHRILCLTYTNAAAAEMENRLFGVLSTWATMPEAELKKTLYDTLTHDPSEKELEISRRLFAKAIETPGGMKVQTIHSFCEKLLQRFPLEARIAPNFKVLDAAAAGDLLKKAVADVLTRALKAPAERIGIALDEIVTNVTDSQFEGLMTTALSHKSAIALNLGPGGKASRAANLAKFLDLPENKDPKHWQDLMNNSLSNDLIDHLTPHLLEVGGKSNEKLAENLKAVRNAIGLPTRIAALKTLFLTIKKEKRKSENMMTKAVREEIPTLIDQFYHSHDLFHDAFIAAESLAIAAATENFLYLFENIIGAYENQKEFQNALDYQDLIDRTAQLLTTHAGTSWVLYKLDQGLDHILVDEAQDTSPEQWKIIARLAEEFFTGLSASERERTIFAVGDEKQSIYGFQGANPRQFGDMGKHFSINAEAAKKTFRNISLNLSFRSTGAVLQAVDNVFQSSELKASLTHEGGAIKHFAHRATEPGLVEIWPTIKTDKQDKSAAFAPLEEAATFNAADELARKIAATIDKWLDQKRLLHSVGRPVEPRDILILVRKRNPFAPYMIRALKGRNIPVAGADRIVITEQIAVMDMMALGQFLMLPEDDLSLACVLKSPIFNLDDDDLFTLSHRRKGSLWQSLRYFAKREQRYAKIAENLSTWLSRADILPPFEFFAHLLEGEGLRKKFVARLGAVAADALDEFLNLSLQYDDQAPPSLQGFLNWLMSTGAEIKRDMEKGRNEVRVMTVHGAKGLEAPVVFLPDTCATGSSSRDNLLALSIEEPEKTGPENKMLLWSLTGKDHLPALKKAKATIKNSNQEEQARLLYVAMTRAKDELYVTGFESVKGRGENCWYNLITKGLEGETEAIETETGETIERLISGVRQPVAPKSEKDTETRKAPPLPAFATTPASAEPHRTIPVAPSFILPYETPENDEDKLPEEPALASPLKLGSDGRFIRGRLVHTLLEYLPDIKTDDRETVAKTLAKAHGAALTEKAREAIIRETLTILSAPEYADLFGEGSKAEVSVIAAVQPKGSDKPPILLQGQIDRLVVRDKEILIVDYKSNRPSPRRPEDVAESYQAQLAAYRLALREIDPEKQVKAALLWTDGPFFMEIPDHFLDQYEKILHRD